MTDADTDTASAARLGAQPHDAAARVLERMAAACRVEHDAATLGRRLAQSDPPGADAVPAERLEWLARVAHEIGLRAQLQRARVAEALAVLEGGVPLLTVSNDGRRWLLLQAPRRRRILLVEHDAEHPEGRERRVDADGVSALLGTDSAAELPWLLVDPSAPNEGAVSEDADGVPLTPVRRLLRLLRPDRGDVLAVALFSVVIGVLLLATPIAVQALVNSVALGGLIQPLIVVTLLLMLALGFAGALTAVQTWIVELLQRRLFVRAIADLAARLPRVRQETYDRVDGPELVNRFFDVVTIQKVAATLLLDALSIVLSIVVGLTILAFYHPILLAFDVILVLVIGGLVLGPLRRGERTAIAESSTKYEVAGWLEEITRNPHAFKVAGAQQWILERADALSRAWVDRRTLHFRTLFAQVVGALGLQVIASTVLLGVGGWLVIQGSLTLGQLVAAELIVTAVVASAAKMGKHLESWYDLMAAVHKVGLLLDLPVESARGELERPRADAAGAALSVRGVEWRNTRGSPVLSGVTLEAAPGARVGVTGPVGAGKSTLVDLLWRLREPTRGSIVLDGRDLRDLSTELLRREVALASRIEVVTGTVRANVKLQRPFVSNPDVWDAIDRVGLHEVIAALPDGLETVIRTEGPMLSDGDRCRLMLARAIAAKPSLLVVDSLLDRLHGAARDRVLDALFDPTAGWTLVVVSEDEDVLARCGDVLRLPPRDATAGEGVLADVGATGDER